VRSGSFATFSITGLFKPSTLLSTPLSSRCTATGVPGDSSEGGNRLSENALMYVAGNIREPEIAPRIFVGQLLMIKPQER
jgi:hypothetical protein